ncbi:carbohydrate kinase family protein [Roseomonas sp. CCTCC AB2023176]|uniref:carbohydrate kinase family protein n=1 Tax=Roseomonas sp. CCTCC AB2023176 TaxID=3342640 RepID=UPI0035D5EB90
MTPELFTAGGVMLDCIVTADGALALEVPGGNALHSAVGAAVMGARAGIVGRVPQDFPFAALAASPVDLGGLLREAAPMPAPEWFFHRSDGSRVDRLHATVAEAAAFGVQGGRIAPALARAWEGYLLSRADPQGGWAAFRAAHPVGPQQVPGAWWSARGVHVAPGPTASQLALAHAARAAGMLVTLDPGFTARGLSPDSLSALLATCDVFLPSEAELRALRPGLAPAAALASLAVPGGPLLIAKLGGAGALVLDPAEGVAHPVPALRTTAPDPTGAGDAFAGGLLAGLLRGEPPVAAARRGAVAASLAVQGPGALAPLRAPAAEVTARLAALQDLPVRSAS